MNASTLSDDPLLDIGLQPATRQLLDTLPLSPDTRAVRVVEIHRETVRLADGRRNADPEAAPLSARLLPALARELAEAGDALAVGDWGLARQDADGSFWLTDFFARRSALTRRDGDGRRHVIVSNVDTALIVMGLDDDFSLRRLERFLALVEGSGVLPVVVLTKRDLCADPTHALTRLQARLPARVPHLALDARQASAGALLAPWLQPGQTLVLLGSSGAGKSTLTNALLGRPLQDTGPTREHDGRGRHTTTSRSLHRLPGGACLIDTPGVRTLRPDADAQVLAASFDDIARLAPACRFRDCRHGSEPGCAVRVAVEADRVDNFQKLQRELMRDHLGPLQRREQLAAWKARSRASRERLRLKRGA